MYRFYLQFNIFNFTSELLQDQASLTHWKHQLEKHNQSVNAQSKFAIIRAMSFVTFTYHLCFILP